MEPRVSLVTSSHPSSVLKPAVLLSDWCKYVSCADPIDQSEAESVISESSLKEISSARLATEPIVCKMTA